jgi:hypothetical protein
MLTFKIKFFSDFCTSEDCKKKFEEMCKSKDIDNYGPDKEIYITCDEDYTHAIILNKAMPELSFSTTINKNNVIGLACEPLQFLGLTQEFVDYAKKNIRKYFIGDLPSELGEPFMEHHGYMWFDHPLPEKILKKTKLLSIVFSQKFFAPGHQYRAELVNGIINNNLPIDIYGRGCKLIKPKFQTQHNIKGEFEDTEPYDDYIFTICIENFSCNQYFSEKIITPIMCETIPIYLGCKNIEQHVKDYYIPLTGDCINDLKLIVNILENPNAYIKNIKSKKEEIFENLNLIKQVKNLF